MEKRRRLPLGHYRDEPPNLLVCLVYSILVAFLLLVVPVFPILLGTILIGWGWKQPFFEVVFMTLAIAMVGVLSWRTWRYGFRFCSKRSSTSCCRKLRMAGQRPGSRLRLVHVVWVLADAALLALLGALVSYRTCLDELAFLPAVACIPFGLVLSLQFQKQGEQRGWPPVAATILTAVCTLAFTPLYCWSMCGVVGTLVWGLPLVAMVTMLFWFVWLIACSIWGEENVALRREVKAHRPQETYRVPVIEHRASRRRLRCHWPRVETPFSGVKMRRLNM